MWFLILLAVIVVIVLIWWIKTSNNFKRKGLKIQEAASGIEVALVNRYDMLTKLLDTAKSFAGHEKEVFTEVIELRRGMSLEEMNQASAKMDSLASGIRVTAEAYPELRSSETFCALQSGIRDAEAHLQAARRLYNSQVTAYNTALTVFPSSLVGNALKLTPEKLFEAEAKKTDDVTISM